MGASAILGLWEEIRGLDAIRRAVAISTNADPNVGEGVALQMPVGERNARLLELRTSWTEDDIEATAECPQCGTVLEFNVNPSQLIAANPSREVQPLHVCDRIIHWRPVSSGDLLRAASEPDDEEAERALIRSCVKEVFEHGRDVSTHDATDRDREALSVAIEKADPLCDLLYELECVECRKPVAASLQIPDVVWGELEDAARQLVSEVDALATAYGWSEADCLALSPSRRATYLETVGAR